eukprot:GGOE01053421.1.p4 GENE.GGOE01053421.1~~GGOE01053421.1.p4  ORF type:complete len:119 (+),score=8.27 GGOE01053421.1:198-554(+)
MMGREACRRKEGVKQPIGGPPALPPKETEGKAAPPVPVECSCFPRHMYGGSCTGKRADWVEGQLAGTSGKLCRGVTIIILDVPGHIRPGDAMRVDRVWHITSCGEASLGSQWIVVPLT